MEVDEMREDAVRSGVDACAALDPDLARPRCDEAQEAGDDGANGEGDEHDDLLESGVSRDARAIWPFPPGTAIPARGVPGAERLTGSGARGGNDAQCPMPSGDPPNDRRC